ncbi:MAG: FecR family protein [Burkholderiales bacterium]|nr:FecR family protein [Burkholderiales bacterium]
MATLTLVEGQVALVRGPRGYVPAEGVKLKHADIVHTGQSGFVQIEFDDGTALELGAGTRFLAHIPGVVSRPPVWGPHFVLSGWAKLSVPKRKQAQTYRIDSPHFDLLLATGVAVLRVGASEAAVFVESGEAIVLEPGSAAQVAVGSGRYYSRQAGQKGVLAGRPTGQFIKTMPPAFRDTLPTRLAKFKGRDVAPKPGPDYAYADVEGWLKTEREVRRALVPLMRAKAGDPDFRAELVKNLRHHGEWDPILFPEKYRPKD